MRSFYPANASAHGSVGYSNSCDASAPYPWARVRADRLSEETPTQARPATPCYGAGGARMPCAASLCGDEAQEALDTKHTMLYDLFKGKTLTP